MHTNALRRFTATVSLALLVAGTGTAAAQASSTDIEPIRVMLSGTFDGAPAGSGFGNVPEALTSARARLDAQNEAGGINGRQIEYIECNDAANQDQAAGCAREAVAEGVVAVIAPVHSATSTASLPILEAEGIAFIGSTPQAPADFISPVSFPLNGGSGASFAAITIALAREGCTKAATLVYSTGASQLILGFIERAIESEGGEFLDPIEVTPSQPDYAPAVAQALDAGAECLVPGVIPNDTVKVVQAVRETGEDLAIGALTTQLPPTTLESLGDAADGILLADSFYSMISDEPAIVQYRSEVEPVGAPLTRPGLQAWTGAQMFIEVSESLDDINKDTFLAAMNEIDGLDLGTMPPISMNEELDSEGFNRAFVRSLFIFVVADETTELLYDEAIDTTSTFP